jgi:hypothetical protein
MYASFFIFYFYINSIFKAVEKDGSSTLEDLNDIQGDILSATTDASTLDNAQIKAGQEGQQEGCGSADAIVLDGKVVSSSDVMLMKKKMDDLELVNLDREKRIQEVCAIIIMIFLYTFVLHRHAKHKSYMSNNFF